jgi:hypothetical protein
MTRGALSAGVGITWPVARAVLSRTRRRAAASASAAVLAAESPETTILCAAASASATLSQTPSRPRAARSRRRIITE